MPSQSQMPWGQQNAQTRCRTGNHTMRIATIAGSGHPAMAAMKKITCSGLGCSAISVWTGLRSSEGSTCCLIQQNGNMSGGHGARYVRIALSTYFKRILWRLVLRTLLSTISAKQAAGGAEPSAAPPPATRCQRMPAPLLQPGEKQLRPQLRMRPLRPPAAASERDELDLPARVHHPERSASLGLGA